MATPARPVSALREWIAVHEARNPGGDDRGHACMLFARQAPRYSLGACCRVSVLPGAILRPVGYWCQCDFYDRNPPGQPNHLTDGWMAVAVE
jgi:hypothetical protein